MFVLLQISKNSFKHRNSGLVCPKVISAFIFKYSPPPPLNAEHLVAKINLISFVLLRLMQK